ncbi:MAG: LptF/LptG family permease [Cyclobacteriaceae bacterium]|nr:LptF/LptG family permease [Cyclobacteriaceae bacterium]UYN85145.1 MAG: LptF/LptG family permease [Cyclobacteriaceae bacterium]
MKKLDKLILSSFLGPFILTFLVVVFILLMQHMLKYFDDIIGKGLGFDVIGQLLFYFAVFMTPVALPLAVLLSSLMTFGALGEHFELTAIKSAGISLLRTIQPIFFFVLVLTVCAFYINNNLVPKAALEAYSLLYDIKQKKPALDLREGTFYNGIPDISIKVNHKFPDNITLKDVIIYDHRKHDGNKDVTIADSGKMYTILNERYLKLELFNGYNYTEGASAGQDVVGKSVAYGTETISRSKFAKTQVVFDLSSFGLIRTEKKWFQGNRIMRNLRELDYDLDSLNREKMNYQLSHYAAYRNFFNYFTRKDSVALPVDLLSYKNMKDSASFNAPFNSSDDPALSVTPAALQSPIIAADSLIDKTMVEHDSTTRVIEPPTLLQQKRARNPERVKQVEQQKEESKRLALAQQKKRILTDSARLAKVDSIMSLSVEKSGYTSAVNKARVVKSQLAGSISTLEFYTVDERVFRIQWHKILASSLACIAMFLIGAPLGAIIKKGGLGVPFLVSILFFIVYYLLTMTGEKWAKQGIVSVEVGVWAADVILLFIGLIFLRQARIDARLFEADFYNVVFDKVSRWLEQFRLRGKGK